MRTAHGSASGSPVDPPTIAPLAIHDRRQPSHAGPHTASAAVGRGLAALDIPGHPRQRTVSSIPSDRSRAMASAFDQIADIIAETSDVPREKITPDSHVIDDLGIDSLDFLDIVFAIDKAFGIKVPIESWTQEVNAGNEPAEKFFVMKNLATRIEELVAAKSA
jgi:acyl carrier protein